MRKIFRILTLGFEMNENLKEDDFLKALDGEDDLGAVIRAHIHIESHLYELVSMFFSEPSYLKSLELEFHQLVKLSLACGLRSEYSKPLNALGTLRNNFAHRLEFKLGKSEIDSLYNSFSGPDKQIIQKSYARTRKITDEEMVKNLNKLESKDQFTLMAVALRAILIAGKNELQGKA